MEQLPSDLRRWIDKGFLQSVDWSGPDNPNLPMDKVGPWQRLKWIIPHREIGSRERKEAIRQENEEYLNYLFSRNIYPTIMYPRAEGITAEEIIEILLVLLTYRFLSFP